MFGGLLNEFGGRNRLFLKDLESARLKGAVAETVTTFGSLPGGDKWIGGVLAPNGCIYGIPFGSTTILKIDTSDDTVTTFGSLPGTIKWAGGVLASNGCIYGIPRDSTSILKIDTGIRSFPPHFLSAYYNKL